ncbi:unnamed protein product [Rotaria sordida]|uniref:Polymerase/histidinol phosphatase N-terminal domain-containing protein n=1 Tax=Rotaria sordida TaxID=392033 RepID=A0A813P2K1_9BILA|nr:unnamed protein product [Rotaria sordida]
MLERLTRDLQSDGRWADELTVWFFNDNDKFDERTIRLIRSSSNNGASNPEELVIRAKELGLAALAITDHDDLGGVPRFAHAAREFSLDGIIGAELTLEDKSHLIVLVQDLSGYRNLCALITLARLEQERGSPFITYEQLFSKAAGLTALSGCHHGAIPAALASEDTMAARRHLKRFVEVFGTDFYLEVGNHFITQEALLVRQLIEMASSTGTITHQLQAFANYGFPESHAASFSLLVYASAFLKRYYPVEFCCAILNAQPMGFYSPASLIRDAVRHEVEVRPVDLARSQWNCTLEPLGPFEPLEPKASESGEPIANSSLRSDAYGFAVRLGLRFVDGLGPTSQAILQVALQNGLFTSVEDVVNRSGLSPSDLKMLAKAGAFETLCPGRRQALWRVLSLLRPKRSMPLLEALIANSTNSDGDAESDLEINCLYELPVILPSMTELEEVVADYRTMNLSTNKHPLSFYRDWAKSRKIHSCMGLYDQEDGEDVVVAGGIICRQRPETAKGFVFLTIEDETGMANVIIKPKQWRPCAQCNT